MLHFLKAPLLRLLMPEIRVAPGAANSRPYHFSGYRYIILRVKCTRT